MATNPVQLPPQALEAEMAVLGSMFIEGPAAEKAFDILVEKDFYQDAHRKIFSALQHIFNRGGAIDFVTASAELTRLKILEEIGGAAYLSELIHRVATAAHVEHYARIVKSKSILRQLITAATNVVTACHAEAKDPAQILDEAQANILKVAETQTLQAVTHAREIAHEVLDQIEASHKDKRAVKGVPSGLVALDNLTTGFQKSDLILIAARPSQGKTALAMNIATHVVLDAKIPTLVFSLEMSRHAIMQRLISTVALVDLKKIRNGFFPANKWTDMTNAAARLAESPLYINDQPGHSILTVRSISRQLAADLKHKGQSLGLIIIDYLQLMRGTGYSESRQQEVSEISRGLKFLARDLNIPVIALSQLSRRTEEKGRADAKPQLSDLRESGALEQDADLVAFIYREAYYKPNDPTLERKAEIIVAKQRQGPTGIVNVAFDRNITRFSNEVLDDAPPAQDSVIEEEQASFIQD